MAAPATAAVSVSVPLTAEFKKKITAATVEAVREEARALIEATVAATEMTADMIPTDFKIIDKPVAISVRVSGDARFVTQFIAIAKSHPGWREMSRVFISEIVQVRPLERRTEEPASAVEAGRPNWNIRRGHAPGTVRNRGAPTKVGTISAVAGAHGVALENVARASSDRRAPSRGIYQNTLLRTHIIPGAGIYTPEMASVTARLFSERLAAEEAAAAGGAGAGSGAAGGSRRHRRRTMKNQQRRRA